MAVTAVLKRQHEYKGVNGQEEIGVATLSGTYVTGGFTVDLRTLTGTLGTSPRGGAPLRLNFDSPLDYDYVSTFGTGQNSQIATVKIFSAANTELTAGATPEASVPFTLVRRFTI